MQFFVDMPEDRRQLYHKADNSYGKAKNSQ